MDTQLEIDQELFAIYNSLGYLQDGIYFKESDCNACLKDLLRFLRNENQSTFATRRQLGNCNFLTTDLAPLVKQHCLNDKILFDYVVRLLSSLTTPPILLFKEQVPDEKEARKIYLDLQQHMFNYKTELSIDVMFWSVIAKQMLKILQIELIERQEEDKVMLERMLILVRNILHISSQDEEDVIAGEDNVHDKLLISMKKACIYDIILYICQTDSEHDLAFHVLEIFSLIYREQNAEELATFINSLRLSEAERQKDIQHLKELKARSKINRTHQDKYQRFKESTYVIKNLKSIGNNDVICHKAISDVSELNLDKNKKIVRKAKNRRFFQDQSLRGTHLSSLELKSYLRDLATSFISTSYNLLMKTIRYYLERCKSQENDESYFVWAAQFFMEFNRISNADVDFVMETMSKEYLHYLHCLIESHLDHLKTDKKNIKLWSKRLHLALKAYKELIYTLAHVQSKSKTESFITNVANDLKRKLFYEEEYRELIRLLIMVYDPIKMSDSYLNDLIESNHLFLKMLEYYCKKSESQVMIQKKIRKQKKKKKNNKEKHSNDEETSIEQSELIWTELTSEISNILQGKTDLPKIENNSDLNVFSLLSEESKDERKLTVMKKINLLLHSRRTEESVALFREARNFFSVDSDDYTFGTFDIKLDEELLALQKIMTDDFLIESNKDEFKKLKKKETDEKRDENLELLEEEQQEQEESDTDEKSYKEQLFNFSDFVKSFANQKILQSYFLAFRNYETNSSRVNSCIIKMFHRISFDCLMHCMFFQLSFFRTIQKIFNDYYDNSFYIDLIRFGKFIIDKFTKVAKINQNVFVEMLYSKSSKDAYVIEYGYEEAKEPAKHGARRKKDNLLELDIHSEGEQDEDLSAIDKYDKLFGLEKIKSLSKQTSLSIDDELIDINNEKLETLDYDNIENKDANRKRGALSIDESENIEINNLLDKNFETKFNDLQKKKPEIFSSDSDNSDDNLESSKKIRSSKTKYKKKYFDSDDDYDEDRTKEMETIESSEFKIKKRKIIDSDDNDNSDESRRSVMKTKRPKLLDSDDDCDEDFGKIIKNMNTTGSMEIRSKKHKIFESDDEENIEKENLYSLMINFEPDCMEKVDGTMIK